MIGFDGNKKVKGRKRHILVDSMGFLLAAQVHSAEIQDRTAAREFVKRVTHLPGRLKVVWADLGYESQPLAELMKKHWGARLELKKHPWQGKQRVWVKVGEKPPAAPRKPKGFRVLPNRWVVERSFAWLTLHRRHSKDYETLPEQSEFFIWLSMTRNMLRRLDV